MKEERFNKFSVPLGLLDYVNPILYTITMAVILKHIAPQMTVPYNIVLMVGAGISVLFGLVIPTGKVIVGLGIIKFQMPVLLVFAVNFGIYLTGLMLLKYTLNFYWQYLALIVIGMTVLLGLMYQKTKKLNTIAVLTGAFGYLMIYASLIILSAQKAMALPVLLYAFAILLFLMLVGVGIKADLKNPKVHWLIEISNVTCQALVAVGTYLLFH